MKKQRYIFKQIITMLLAICMVLSTAVIFGGCGKDKSGNYPVQVANIKIKEEPKNIVALSANAADILANTGYAIKLVGKSDSCTQSAISVVPSVGAADAPDVDAIIAAGTDLVFADNTLGEIYSKQLTEAGITVIKLAQPETKSEIETLYKTIGSVAGGGVDGLSAAQTAFGQLYTDLNSAASLVPTSGMAYSICYLTMDANGELYTTAQGSFIDTVLSSTGAATVINSSINGGQTQISEQNLVQFSPNFIFYDSDEVAQHLQTNATTREMGAVTQAHLYKVSQAQLNLMGISAAMNAADLIKLMYPEIANNGGIQTTIPDATEGPTGDGENPTDSSTQVGDLSSQYGITITSGMVIDENSSQSDIQALQQRLKDLGYYTGDTDGKFGDLTQRCIGDFQYLNNFTVDNIADEDVLKEMFNSNAVKRTDQ